MHLTCKPRCRRCRRLEGVSYNSCRQRGVRRAPALQVCSWTSWSRGSIMHSLWLEDNKDCFHFFFSWCHLFLFNIKLHDRFLKKLPSQFFLDISSIVPLSSRGSIGWSVEYTGKYMVFVGKYIKAQPEGYICISTRFFSCYAINGLFNIIPDY